MEKTEISPKSVVTPDFTIVVSTARNSDDKMEIGLRDIDEPTFLAANRLVKADKELEAVKFIVRQLRVSGAPAEDFCSNFHAIRAAVGPVMELIRPLEGELKKN